jgi:hypothetical protein
MANNGSNMGRTLRPALSRFAAMLVEEARDLLGLTYPKLDEKLKLIDGTTQRYALYPTRKETRAPQADEIQNLENIVAAAVQRPAHIVVIENNALLADGAHLLDIGIGVPDAKINLRQIDKNSLQLGYEDDWPTYRRLKYTRPRGGVSLLELYAWQWGVLWDRGVLREPWTREAQGIAPDVPTEDFLPKLVEEAKQQRLAVMMTDPMCRNFAGIDL